MKTPYFAFYPQDWLSDPKVAQLTYEERGVYFDLLCRMWTFNDGSCSLPDNDQFICRILGVMPAKWKKLKAVLIDGPAPVIDRHEGRLVNKRLVAEFMIATKKSEKNSVNAKKRWGDESRNHLNDKEVADANAIRSECHSDTDTEKDKERIQAAAARDVHSTSAHADELLPDPPQSDPPQQKTPLPAIPTDAAQWCVFWQRQGYDLFTKVKTPAVMDMLRDWVKRGISVELVTMAVEYVRARDGVMPRSPRFFADVVNDYLRKRVNSGLPANASHGNPAQGAVSGIAGLSPAGQRTAATAQAWAEEMRKKEQGNG